MKNPFRDPTMKDCFDAGVRGFDTRHKDFFHADGTPNRGNSPAGYFWRGYEGVQMGTWDAESKKMLGYAYWKAGVACRKHQPSVVSEAETPIAARKAPSRSR